MSESLKVDKQSLTPSIQIHIFENNCKGGPTQHDMLVANLFAMRFPPFTSLTLFIHTFLLSALPNSAFHFIACEPRGESLHTYYYINTKSNIKLQSNIYIDIICHNSIVFICYYQNSEHFIFRESEINIGMHLVTPLS